MKMAFCLKSAMPFIVWLAFFVVTPAHAKIDNQDLLDGILNQYKQAAVLWETVITDAASWLFWTLVVISMVWTFGMMALRKADIGEFFAEFLRFTIFTGFFWWLLINGPDFASSIYDSLRQIAGKATGLGPGVTPSGIVDIGFDIFYMVVDKSSIWSPVDSFAGFLLSVAILVMLALISINMLLLLISGWILAYGGIFFLGFGGSRWTSDMAINYYKTVLGVATQLMTMVLLIGIGRTFLTTYYAALSKEINLNEMGVMLVASLVLLVLVNKVPQMIAGIITGASVGGAGIGNLGAGAALGAATMGAAAASTMWSVGSNLVGGAKDLASRAKDLMSAFSKAGESASEGTDMMSDFGDDALGGEGTDGSNDGEMLSDDTSTGDTPFSQAAGFNDDEHSGGDGDSTMSSDDDASTGDTPFSQAAGFGGGDSSDGDSGMPSDDEASADAAQSSGGDDSDSGGDMPSDDEASAGAAQSSGGDGSDSGGDMPSGDEAGTDDARQSN